MTATQVNIADPTTPTNIVAVNSLGQISIANFPSTQSVIGTVTVAAFPAVQVISGSADITDRSTRQVGVVSISGGVSLLATSNNIGAVQQALKNMAIAAGTGSANVVIRGSGGYLSGALCTAGGSTANLLIYDHPSSNSGTVIGVIPSGATAGQYFPFNMPAMSGITAAQVNGSPAVTVAYS
jgi:hypothetical protein